MARRPDEARELDLVLLGATGFTGRIVAGYLARAAPSGLRVGLAGRSMERLRSVRDGLGGHPASGTWSLVGADLADQQSLDAMARRARLVLSAAGPYAPAGLGVVQACALSGTHYADLTGEPQFVRTSIDAVDAVARESGARIVHSAGFDSVPSDLGVWDLAQRVRSDGEGELTVTTLALHAGSGSFGGGSVVSLLGVAEAMRRDPAMRALLTDPYTLSPDRAGEPDVGDAPLVPLPRFDEAAQEWVVPFLPLGIPNERTVRRTNALLGYPYGRRFAYRETIGLGTGPLRAAVALVGGLGMKGAEVALIRSPAGGILDTLVRRVGPEPGTGPSERVRTRGRFGLSISTLTTSGARYVEDVAADGDPGYTATAMMIGEAALAQLLDADRLPDRAGVLTPAAAYGDVLTDRLRSAGMTFQARRAG